METKSSNPTLPANTFSSLRYTADRSEAMTVSGTVYKTIMLLMLVMLAAGWTWMKFYNAGGNAAAIAPWIGIGAIGGFVMAMVLRPKLPNLKIA